MFKASSDCVFLQVVPCLFASDRKIKLHLSSICVFTDFENYTSTCKNDHGGSVGERVLYLKHDNRFQELTLAYLCIGPPNISMALL